MEIRSPSNEPSRPAQSASDITRLNREAIRKRMPEPLDAEDMRAELARQQEQEAQRIAAARQAYKAERAQNAREKRSERAHDAREKALASQDQVRAASADPAEAPAGQPSRAERLQNAREAYLAERAQNARDVLAAKGAQDSTDRISLSETSLRLRAHAARGGQGVEDETRAARIAELRELHQSGSLNTDELIARAAFKLLSGE